MTRTANPRRANGHRRTQLRNRVLREETHCAICAGEVDKLLPTPDPFSAEVDEILPVSMGGNPLDRANVQLTHRICNRCKSTGQHTGSCPRCQETAGRTQPGQPSAGPVFITNRKW